MREGDTVHRAAAAPDGDLACDFTIARDLAQSGFRERLAASIIGPVRQLEDGVEMTFAAEASGLVREYIDVESRCCPFLDLSARTDGGTVVLTVTGRAEAREFIRNIFATADADRGGQQ
ncbi:MAG: hypothetical protein ACYC9X_00455 [Dehalococcoidia bacterium]